jgi:hypothetical protein
MIAERLQSIVSKIAGFALWIMYQVGQSHLKKETQNIPVIARSRSPGDEAIS